MREGDALLIITVAEDEEGLLVKKLEERCREVKRDCLDIECTFEDKVMWLHRLNTFTYYTQNGEKKYSAFSVVVYKRTFY